MGESPGDRPVCARLRANLPEIKGVREGDVLGLNPELVIESRHKAVQAYANALDFVRQRCGAIRPVLGPSTTMLLPLADQLAPDRARRGDLEDDLERWFWATAFSQTYSQGANTPGCARRARAARVAGERRHGSGIHHELPD